MVKRIALALGVLLFIYACCAIGFSIVDQKIFEPRLQAAFAPLTRNAAEIESDLQLVSRSQLFPPHGGMANADDLLFQHIPLYGSKVEVSAEYQAFADRFKGQLALEDAKSLADLAVLASKVDTSWMTDLVHYDYWDFSSRTEVHKILQNVPAMNSVERIGVFATMPIPDYRALENWSLIYLLQTNKKGKAEIGLELNRHIAHLSQSSGTLVGQMMAVTLLNYENTLAHKWSRHGFVPVDPEVLAAYKRVSWAWAGIDLAGFSAEFPKFAEAYERPENGMCGGTFEQLGQQAFREEFLAPSWPLEGDYHVGLEDSRRHLMKQLDLCGLGAWKAFTDPVAADGSRPSAALIPFYRRFYALTLATVATPNFMRGYPVHDAEAVRHREPAHE